MSYQADYNRAFNNPTANARTQGERDGQAAAGYKPNAVGLAGAALLLKFLYFGLALAAGGVVVAVPALGGAIVVYVATLVLTRSAESAKFWRAYRAAFIGIYINAVVGLFALAFMSAVVAQGSVDEWAVSLRRHPQESLVAMFGLWQLVGLSATTSCVRYDFRERYSGPIGFVTALIVSVGATAVAAVVAIVLFQVGFPDHFAEAEQFIEPMLQPFSGDR